MQYRTRVVASEDTGLFGALKIKIGDYTGMGISAWEALEVNSADKVLACEIELPTTAADEYQGKACKIAFTVEAVQGNAETVNDTAYYTLEQFNALTEIPAGIKNVYVYVNKISVTATAFISLLDANMSMPEGKTFTTSGNTLSGVPVFVKLKDNAEITPGF